MKYKKSSAMNKNLMLTAAGITLLFLSSCTSICDYEKCSLKFPVYLVHGIGFSESTSLISYWDGVTPELDRLGIPWFKSSQPAFGLIEDNAGILKEDIRKYLLLNPQYTKVNIIAHSRGGLESRFMISRLDMGSYVASLTTIATPHRGSSMADLVYSRIRHESSPVVLAMNKIFGLIDKSDPSSFQSGRQLTPDSMSVFNIEVPDIQGVYYQSYAGCISPWYPAPLFATLYTILEEFEGPNDGLVSVESAKWGEFKGVPPGKTTSHASIIGFDALDASGQFDAHRFIRQVLTELSAKGF